MALDLRTGLPVWLIHDENKPSHPQLSANIKTEVVVVGGGISGALLSFVLTEMGMAVVLVDSREISAGSTSASTAILSYETDVMLQDLVKTAGVENAVRVFTLGIEALDFLEETIGKLDDNCDFKKRNSVYYASTEEDAKIIKDEYAIRKKYGFNTEYIDDVQFADMFPFQAPCALLTKGMSEVDPVKLTRALIRMSEKRGMQIYSETKIDSFVTGNNGSILKTDKGYTIDAKHIVFASGYETQQMLKQDKVKLISSYAIASDPVLDFTDWYERSTLWESARPYIYVRTTADNRIVAGGEDVAFTNEKARDALLPAKTKILETKIRKLFPHTNFTTAASWAGTFAESADGLPYIGVHDKYPGAYFALGYGGNGITFAAMASGIIPDLIRDIPNTDADIFRFRR